MRDDTREMDNTFNQLPAEARSLRAGLFLDRDGTVIDHIPYLHDPNEVRLVPEARACLKEAMSRGVLLFLHTNQSGVGRGYFKMPAVHACNERMLELLDLPEPGFTEICIAPEAPGEPSPYRKPSPRFIKEMIDRHDLDPGRCFMIGDMPSDMEAATNAGITGLKLDENLSLAAAVRQVLEKLGA